MSAYLCISAYLEDKIGRKTQKYKHAYQAINTNEDRYQSLIQTIHWHGGKE